MTRVSTGDNVPMRTTRCSGATDLVPFGTAEALEHWNSRTVVDSINWKWISYWVSYVVVHHFS